MGDELTNEDSPTQSQWQGFFESLVAQMSEEQKAAMLRWAQELLELRASEMQPMAKIKRAIEISKRSAVLLPLIRILWKEVKRLGWDERGLPARLGMSAAVLGIATLGFAGTGIAMFGGAIGVPLWVLFGGGGMAIGALIDEIRRTQKSK